VLFITLFTLLKGNTTFKDILAWMVFNSTNQILKWIFQNNCYRLPPKDTAILESRDISLPLRYAYRRR